MFSNLPLPPLWHLPPSGSLIALSSAAKQVIIALMSCGGEMQSATLSKTSTASVSRHDPIKAVTRNTRELAHAPADTRRLGCTGPQARASEGINAFTGPGKCMTTANSWTRGAVVRVCHTPQGVRVATFILLTASECRREMRVQARR